MTEMKKNDGGDGKNIMIGQKNGNHKVSILGKLYKEFKVQWKVRSIIASKVSLRPGNKPLALK
jgi:hypothetical protein